MPRFMQHESWRDACFVHFEVNAEMLQKRLPSGLVVDLCDGRAYVGVVLLTEVGIVPFPPGIPLWFVRCLGLTHHAVNVRTYVRPIAGGQPGVFFFAERTWNTDRSRMERKCPGASSRCWYGIGSLSGIRYYINSILKEIIAVEESDLITVNTAPAC